MSFKTAMIKCNGLLPPGSPVHLAQPADIKPGQTYVLSQQKWMDYTVMEDEIYRVTARVSGGTYQNKRTKWELAPIEFDSDPVLVMTALDIICAGRCLSGYPEYLIVKRVR